jgi:hypothetical protein
MPLIGPAEELLMPTLASVAAAMPDRTTNIFQNSKRIQFAN